MFLPFFISIIKCRKDRYEDNEYSSSSSNDLLSGPFNLILKKDNNFRLLINEGNIRLVNTKRSTNIDKSKSNLTFHELKDGYKISNSFGSICKKSEPSDPGVVNCHEKPNKFGIWNIHSRKGGFIIESRSLCLRMAGPVRKDEKKGSKFWNYVHAKKCDPLQTDDINFLFLIRKVRGPGYESRTQRLMREENEQSSSDSNSGDSSDEDSTADQMNRILCAHKYLPDHIRMGPHFQGFQDIFNPC